MVDVAGDYGGGPKVTCILKEGDITINAAGFGADGLKGPVATLASAVSKGDYVQINTDTGNTYAATGGLPVVSAVASAGGVFGKVIDEPRWVTMPTSNQSTWSSMLSSGYYRVATVELYPYTSVIDVSVVGDASNAVTPGDTDTLKYDVSAGEFETAASGGSGVSLHYVAAAAASGTRCLMALTGGALVSKA